MPLKHYVAMALIFRNSMATGKYAKSSNDPLGDAYLGTEGTEEEDHDVPTTPVMIFLILSLMNNMAHHLLLDQIREPKLIISRLMT
jgi:hypothetical protein